MSDDCFDGFRRVIRGARGNAPPTLRSQTIDFKRHFAEVITAVDTMEKILSDEQPTSSIAYNIPEFNLEENSLFINIRGEKDSRIASVLIFSYQDGCVHALNNSFKEANRDRTGIWTRDEQEDLVRRIVQHFSAFFSKH